MLGVYDVYGSSPDAALRNAAQTPGNDPLLLIPAMAAVTENLGFGVTSNLSFEPPYTFARRMSTLDHLTDGRVGWNVVTGYLDSAARGAGKDKQTAHDDRYDIADEYMEVVYKLWEGSWEDDAVLRDRARGIFADPAKVHRVHHEGKNYRLDAIHLSEPSPQRTPVLYQAGTSPRGRQFAARARRMRVHVGTVGEGDRAARRRHPRTRREGRAQSRGDSHVQHVHRRSSAEPRPRRKRSTRTIAATSAPRAR